MTPSFPSVVRSLLLLVLLATLVACDGATLDSGLPGDTPPDTTPATSTIDLRDAAALGITTVQATAGALARAQNSPQVVTVSNDGAVEAVEDDEATFRDFRIIGDRVFLVPNDIWSYGCALVEVIDDTSVECVDPYLREFYDLVIGADGTLYYEGYGETETDEGANVLRKRAPDGTTAHVFTLNGPLTVYDWGVAADGLVYLSGETFTSTGSGGTWVRRLNDDGSLTTIKEQTAEWTTVVAQFLGVWPDGNLYLHYQEGYESIRRILPDEDVISDTAFIGDRSEDTTVDEVLYDATELDLPIHQMNPDDLRWSGERLFATVTDYAEYGTKLVVLELYPNPQRFESGLPQVRAAAAHGEDYYFAGRLDSGGYGIVRLDTTTGTTETTFETTTLEMFSMTVNPDGTALLFDAFDAAHNRYVLATVEIATGNVATEPVTSTLTKLQPLQ